jgi:hypothetical protein
MAATLRRPLAYWLCKPVAVSAPGQSFSWNRRAAAARLMGLNRRRTVDEMEDGFAQLFEAVSMRRS